MGVATFFGLGSDFGNGVPDSIVFEALIEKLKLWADKIPPTFLALFGFGLWFRLHFFHVK